MEETLRALYKLQMIDLQLDELDEGSGDLPTEVDDLKKQADTLTSSIEAEERKLDAVRKERNSSNGAIQDLRERIKMLNERLRTVRNNKEYEATTSEIEMAETELQNMESGFSSFEGKESVVKIRMETLTKQRDELNRELDEKAGTLTLINETHADEINDLHAAKKEILTVLDSELLRKYAHIRTAHSDAVVKVRKGACTGCYRAITPQTIVEMRRGEQVFICEHCGRMLVDEEIVASVTEI